MPGILPDRSNALLSMTLDGDSALFAPYRMRAEERLSTPYSIALDVVSHRGDVTEAEVLNKAAAVTLRWGQSVKRRFSGLAREFSALEAMAGGLFAYRLVVVPKLWGLSMATDCRVFEAKTTQDILKTLLDEAGVAHEFRITGENPQLPFRAQYNETTLAFAQRLMEEAGWFYYFQHAEAAEMVVIADANSGFETLPDAVLDFGQIDALRPQHSVAPGKLHTGDYNPEQPTASLAGEQPTVLATKGTLSQAGFLWPGHAKTASESTARMRRRMEAEEANAHRFVGEGSMASLVPGVTFEVGVAVPTIAAGKYGVLSVNHDAVDMGWMAGGGAPRYANQFELFSTERPWRERLDTPRPRLAGVYAGIVIDAGDNNLVGMDTQGRVKVRLLWDHRAETSPANGVWARVVQPWAGNGFGAQFVPRVGSEVAVSFMDGDPDRPVVLGGFYHSEHVAIFPPGKRSVSGFRTRSFNGKAASGSGSFSEFSFDDADGQELVLLHAQKDLKVTVENDQHLKVENSRIVSVKQNENLTIKGKQFIEVTKDRSVKVTQGDVTETVELGSWKLKASAGSVMIEAMQDITLKVGENSVKISLTGVEVKGMMLKLEGTAMADLKSPMTTVKGDGMLTLKGGITMIN